MPPLPTAASIIPLLPTPLRPLVTKIVDFGPQSYSLYLAYIKSQNITSALLSSPSHRNPYFPSKARPHAPLPRLQSLHLSRTRNDVLTAGPTALICLLPIVGYAATLGAFAKPRFFLSRQFYGENERVQFGWDDVRGRMSNYDGIVDRLGSCYVNSLRLELLKVPEFGEEEGGGAVDDFEDSYGIDKLPHSHLVALAASRGVNRWNEVVPVLRFYPTSWLRDALRREAMEIKRDDWLIKNELDGGIGGMGGGEVREAMVDRGIGEDEGERILKIHVDIAGRDVGFLDEGEGGREGVEGSVGESLLLHLPIILQHEGGK